MRKTAKKVTIDDVWAIIAEIGELRKENEKELKKSREEREKGMQELRKALKESIRSTEEGLKKSREKSEKEMQELRKVHEETEKTLNKAIGGLSNTMGLMVEKIMTAGLPEKFKKFGFSFGRITTTKLVTGENNIFTQIDGLLENGTQAMAVEVKTKLNNEDVDDHLIRMEKVRQYSDFHGDKREFFGAIAATIIDESTKKYALQKGFFVIEPSGEDVKVTKPPSAKIW